MSDNPISADDLAARAEGLKKIMDDRPRPRRSAGTFSTEDHFVGRIVSERQRLRLDAVNVALSIHRPLSMGAPTTADPDVVLATAGKIIELIEGVKL